MKKITVMILVSFLLSISLFAVAEKGEIFLLQTDRNLDISSYDYDDENIYYVTYDDQRGMTEIKIFNYVEKIFTTREIYRDDELYSQSFSVTAGDKYNNPKTFRFLGGGTNSKILTDDKYIYVSTIKYFYVFDKNLKYVYDHKINTEPLEMKKDDEKIYISCEFEGGYYSYNISSKEMQSIDKNTYEAVKTKDGKYDFSVEKKNGAFFKINK